MEARAADLERAGHTREGALRQARLEMGAVEHHKEGCRQARGLGWLDALRMDLLYAFRGLNRNKVFSLIAAMIPAHRSSRVAPVSALRYE